MSEKCERCRKTKPDVVLDTDGLRTCRQCTATWEGVDADEFVGEMRRDSTEITDDEIKAMPSGDPAQWGTSMRELCQEIEKLPASEQQTAISIKAYAIYQSLAEFNRYCDAQFEDMRQKYPDILGNAKPAQQPEQSELSDFRYPDRQCSPESTDADKGVCECGHKQTLHYENANDCMFQNCGLEYGRARCKHFKPAQQPEPSEVCETDFEDAEAIAKFFHYTYERLAPDFGYETRPDTKQFDAESPNGKLMIAVCGEFLAGIRKPATPPASEPSRDAVIEAAAKFAEGCDMQNYEAEGMADFAIHFAGQQPSVDLRTVLAYEAGQRAERAKVAALKIALADAIRCPMGVCPDSAVGLLTVEELKDAENRRIEGKSPAIKHIGLTGEAK